MTTSHKHHFIFHSCDLIVTVLHNVNLLYISQLQLFFCKIGQYTMWIYLAVVIFVMRNCDCLTVLQYESHNVALNFATVFVSHNYDFVTHIATLYLTLWQSWFCFWQFCLTIYHNWDIVSQCDTVFRWKSLTLLLCLTIYFLILIFWKQMYFMDVHMRYIQTRGVLCCTPDHHKLLRENNMLVCKCHFFMTLHQTLFVF